MSETKSAGSEASTVRLGTVQETYRTRQSDADGSRRWWLIDAEGQTLGRLATQVATLLRGKHKAIFTPHLDVGDYVVVVNCEKIQVSGKRLEEKQYYRHSGYPGGLHRRSLGEMMERRPERVIELAVKGMLPSNALGRRMLRKLRVYSGPAHPHAAQQPTVYELEQKG